jgi:tetratricopeptide (TPR) repeat protein
MPASRALLYLYVFAGGALLAQTDPCVELERLVDGQASAGAEEIASTLREYASSGAHSNTEARCAAIVYSIYAASIGASGRIGEAEIAAERSLAILDKLAVVDQQLLTRTLHTLIVMRLESGKTAKAWQAYRRMKTIDSPLRGDRAMVHEVGAALLHASGRLKECALEYLEVLRAIENGEHQNSANSASILTVLALVYSEDHRVDEAKHTLDRVDTILRDAADVVPLDRIRALHVRGVLFKERHQWVESERVLREVATLAEKENLLGSVTLSSLWSDFAAVLRKTSRRDEARRIEARAAGFRTQPGSNASVDVTELAAPKQGRE